MKMNIGIIMVYHFLIVPQGETRSFDQVVDYIVITYEIVESICKSVGLFVVPVGEMKCFDKTVNKEKKDWVYHVLKNYNLAVESKLEDARKFV